MSDWNYPLPGTFAMTVSRMWRDTGFRKVLKHPVAAAHLLQLACAKFGMAALDPQAMRKEPTRQTGPQLEQAESDVIWSSPDAWPGVACTYFQIEVQSKPEPDMALRMLRYVVLHSFQVRSDHKPPLPVTVPVVFYTGERPWNPSLETGALYAAAPAPFRPLLRYAVVDLCRLEVPEGCGNVIALLAPVVRGETGAEVMHGARALYRRLVELGDKPMEESFFDLVLAQCEEKWPEENWKDCASMAELVDALEERVTTWPEKWKARYVAEGRAEGVEEGHTRGRAEGVEEGRAQGKAMLASLEKAVRSRFGEAAARSFGQQLEVARQVAAAQGLEIMDAVFQCVMQSENAEQLMTGLRSIRTGTA